MSHHPVADRGGWKYRRFGVLLFVGLVMLTACGHMGEGSSARPIRTQARVAEHVPAREGSPHAPSVLGALEIPPHPYMAPHGASSMHSDPFTSNVYSWSGPVGRDTEVDSRSMGFLGGECPTVNFDRKGRLVAVCIRFRSPTLVLLEPSSLRVLATHALPQRHTPLLRIRTISNDTSGGAYFYLDERDRAVIGTAEGTIEIVSTREDARGIRFELDERIDLSRALRLDARTLDKITAVMPDYQGNYWFVGRRGTVGVVTRERHVASLRLAREEIENSFSVAPEGVYIVSDHALYRFELGRDGAPRSVWRATYDRGTRRKVGQINQGSGTTPTLLGSEYVAIGDNADPQMHVLVYRRRRDFGERIVCSIPVFSPGKSGTENTLIGYGRSLVVENNYGYDIVTTMRHGRTSTPGIARIDVRPDESGCDLVWESDEISQTAVPKLSTATGLVYLYTKMPDAPSGGDAFYFTAVDFQTGRTVYRVLTGTGMRWDNHWAAISLAPDGTAFVGVFNGIIRIRDGDVPPLARASSGAAGVPGIVTR